MTIMKYRLLKWYVTLAVFLAPLVALAKEDEETVLLEGRQILGAPAAELDRVRGGRVAMIFQDPASALNPVLTIRKQLCEALALHRALAVAGAHFVNFFGRFATEDVVPWRGPELPLPSWLRR